jgi:hypothetical protein
VASYWSRNRTKALLVLLGFCWLLWQRRIGWFDRLGLHNPKVDGSIPSVATNTANTSYSIIYSNTGGMLHKGNVAILRPS